MNGIQVSRDSIVDMGGFGHRVNSDSIRNGGAI